MVMLDRPTGRYAVVILAAGSSSRIGGVGNKVYLPLVGRSIVTWSIEVFSRIPGVERFVLVIRSEDRDIATRTLRNELPGIVVDLVEGGESRHDSEHNAIEHLAPVIIAGDLDLILIHDGDRPCVTEPLIYRVIDAARRWGGAIPVVVIDDFLHSIHIETRLTNNTYVLAQTPQAFAAPAVLAAYKSAHDESFRGTDTSECMERYSNVTIRVVAGDSRNIKVTNPEDLSDAELFLRTSSTS